MSSVTPADLERERAILGALILCPSVMHELREFRADDFASAAHGEIFRTLEGIRGSIDIDALANELDIYGTLQAVGGRAALEALVEDRPLLRDMRDRLAATIHERRGGARNVAIGLPALEARVAGFRRGELVVLAGECAEDLGFELASGAARAGYRVVVASDPSVAPLERLRRLDLLVLLEPSSGVDGRTGLLQARRSARAYDLSCVAVTRNLHASIVSELADVSLLVYASRRERERDVVTVVGGRRGECPGQVELLRDKSGRLAEEA